MPKVSVFPSCVKRAIIACTMGFPEPSVSIVPSSMDLCSWASRRDLDVHRQMPVNINIVTISRIKHTEAC